MYPPAERWKRHVWKAVELARGRTSEITPLDLRDEAGRAKFYDSGVKQLARLEQRIHAATGLTIDPAWRVFDYGCGVGRLALPLAERCEYVYGMDVSEAALHQAHERAQQLGITNVDWLEVGRLGELEGRYDLLVSMFVFQHIRRPLGEQTFATLVKGLRPGGVAAIQFVLMHPPNRLSLDYVYSLGKTYSLNRLGRLLADQGISDWHVKFNLHRGTARPYYDAIVIFRKNGAPRPADEIGEQASAEFEPAAV
jgi:2-polyprenyl-3-methyl-5-hydroxy-6-metoxy-1,4-benzoquinol methylase